MASTGSASPRSPPPSSAPPRLTRSVRSVKRSEKRGAAAIWSLGGRATVRSVSTTGAHRSNGGPMVKQKSFLTTVVMIAMLATTTLIVGYQKAEGDKPADKKVTE